MKERKMIEFKRQGSVKLVADGSSIIPFLLRDGWSSDVVGELNREDLTKQANDLGVKFHPNAKNETIKAKIDGVLNGSDSE